MIEARKALRDAISKYAGAAATPAVISRVDAELPAIRLKTGEEGQKRLAEMTEAARAGKDKLRKRFLPVSTDRQRCQQEEERTRDAMERYRAWIILNDPNRARLRAITPSFRSITITAANH